MYLRNSFTRGSFISGVSKNPLTMSASASALTAMLAPVGPRKCTRLSRCLRIRPCRVAMLHDIRPSLELPPSSEASDSSLLVRTLTCEKCVRVDCRQELGWLTLNGWEVAPSTASTPCSACKRLECRAVCPCAGSIPAACRVRLRPHRRLALFVSLVSLTVCRRPYHTIERHQFPTHTDHFKLHPHTTFRRKLANHFSVTCRVQNLLSAKQAGDGDAAALLIKHIPVPQRRVHSLRGIPLRRCYICDHPLGYRVWILSMKNLEHCLLQRQAST